MNISARAIINRTAASHALTMRERLQVRIDELGLDMLTQLDLIFASKRLPPGYLRFQGYAIINHRYLVYQLNPRYLGNLSINDLIQPAVTDRLSAVARRTVLAQFTPQIGLTYSIALRDEALPVQTPAAEAELPTVVPFENTLGRERPFSVPFGVTASGPQMLDLSMPNHILIAGTTQTGKSRWIQAVLAALCTHNTPEQVRIAIVDPKGYFVHWHDIPHLYAPRATEAKPAMKLIGAVVDEMDRRRRLFEAVTALDLEHYEQRTGKRLPLLVVVIDEFVDLALEIGRAYVPVLMRLVNKAASYGIRLILATQSPKADIVDSSLRQQCGIRIAFRCTDVWQSEYVLGQGKRDAAKLPNIPGRFVAQLPGAIEMVEGQAYFIDNGMLDTVTARLRGTIESASNAVDETPEITLTDQQREMVRFALRECDGYFKLREISREFCGTLTAPQWLREMAQEWEGRGWLHKPAAANASRLIGRELRESAGWVEGKDEG